MTIRVGCHISIKNGFDGAAQTAVSLGCGAFQYFPKNPRSLSVKAFDTAEAGRSAVRCRTHDVLSVAHSPYPVNLATEDQKLAEVTRLSLLNDLEIAEAVGSMGVVVHFGKYSGNDPLQGYKNIILLLDRILAEWRGNAQLLIENQAGGMGTTHWSRWSPSGGTTSPPTTATAAPRVDPLPRRGRGPGRRTRPRPHPAARATVNG